MRAAVDGHDGQRTRQIDPTDPHRGPRVASSVREEDVARSSSKSAKSGQTEGGGDMPRAWDDAKLSLAVGGEAVDRPASRREEIGHVVCGTGCARKGCWGEMERARDVHSEAGRLHCVWSGGWAGKVQGDGS